MKYLPLFFIVLLLAGTSSSCKHPTETKPIDTTHVDTTKHPCDTCNISHDGDTSSHAFTWTEYTIPQENNLTGVAVFGPSSIYAVNNVLYRFNGSSWNKVQFTDTRGRSIDGLSGFSMFGFSESDCWLVLADEALHITSATATTAIAEDYRLGDLGVTHYPTDGMLHACWGTSSHDMFFVGDSGTILHFDGTNWMKFPKVTGKLLYSVWGTSHTNVWASGFNPTTGESILLHFDGSIWSEDALSSSQGTHAIGGFDAVWSCDSSGHSITLTSGALLVRKTDNGLWRSDSSPVPNALGDGTYVGLWRLRGNTANDILTAGDGGFVAHWNGRGWYRYDQFFKPSSLDFITNGLSVEGNTACVVGKKNGASWILVGQR